MKSNYKKLICIVMAVFTIINVTACARNDSPQHGNESDNTHPATATSNSRDITENVSKGPDINGKAADEQFISSQRNFALELFRQCVNDSKKNGNENVLVSPLSVMLALTMTANGADGETFAEMEAVLAASDIGGNLTIDDLNKYLYDYVKNLSSDENTKLRVADSIWIRESFSEHIKESFVQKNVDYYGAEIMKAPFDVSTVNDINNWVSENTDGMIEKIVEEIDPLTVMYLVNALCFDAEWEDKYFDSSVYDDKFTNANGEETAVRMMRSQESAYLESESAVGFVKNYKGGNYSFAALLPEEDVNIYDYINSLHHGELSEILDNASHRTVNAGIPQFEFDYGISLEDSLKAMGMEKAFDESAADFSKMSDEDLYINKVLHKTFIKVDQKGTKAGAATSVDVNCESVIQPEEPVSIILDRPFVFMILDNNTNLPVFIGCVTNL